MPSLGESLDFRCFRRNTETLFQSFCLEERKIDTTEQFNFAQAGAVRFCFVSVVQSKAMVVIRRFCCLYLPLLAFLVYSPYLVYARSSDGNKRDTTVGR